VRPATSPNLALLIGLRPKAQDSLSVMAASAEWSAMRASAQPMPTAGAGSRPPPGRIRLPARHQASIRSDTLSYRIH
jgi:hypothetical protein